MSQKAIKTSRSINSDQILLTRPSPLFIQKEAEIGVLTVSDTKITTGGMAVSPTPRFWLPRSVNLTLLQDSHMGIALTRRPHACGA